MKADYDGEVFDVLTYESSIADRTDFERKLKRRLREKKLGAYDQSRVDEVRSCRDTIRHELAKVSGSEFYSRSGGRYATLDDWDVDGLRRHVQDAHPQVAPNAIAEFLPHAIHVYYLR